jgi:hypothetical protein
MAPQGKAFTITGKAFAISKQHQEGTTESKIWLKFMAFGTRVPINKNVTNGGCTIVTNNSDQALSHYINVQLYKKRLLKGIAAILAQAQTANCYMSRHLHHLCEQLHGMQINARLLWVCRAWHSLGIVVGPFLQFAPLLKFMPFDRICSNQYSALSASLLMLEAWINEFNLMS